MRHKQPDDGYAVRGLAFTHPRGPVTLPHADGWDQLIYAASGVMTVHTDDGVWVIPPDRAVWVPSGLGNRVEMGGQSEHGEQRFGVEEEAQFDQSAVGDVEDL